MTTTATLNPVEIELIDTPCGRDEFPDTQAGWDWFALNHLRECGECQRHAADTADIH